MLHSSYTARHRRQGTLLRNRFNFINLHFFIQLLLLPSQNKQTNKGKARMDGAPKTRFQFLHVWQSNQMLFLSNAIGVRFTEISRRNFVIGCFHRGLLLPQADIGQAFTERPMNLHIRWGCQNISGACIFFAALDLRIQKRKSWEKCHYKNIPEFCLNKRRILCYENRSLMLQELFFVFKHQHTQLGSHNMCTAWAIFVKLFFRLFVGE